MLGTICFEEHALLPLSTPTRYEMLSRLGQRSLKASTSAARPILGRRLQTTADSSSLIGPIPADGDAPFQIKLHQEYFQTYRCEAPALEMEVTKNQLVDSYKMMVTMRRMEMAADQVRSTLHPPLSRPPRVSTPAEADPFVSPSFPVVQGSTHSRSLPPPSAL